MEYRLLYDLVESLHNLALSTPEKVAQLAADSLWAWAKPGSVLVRIEYSEAVMTESSRGDSAHLKLINDLYGQLKRIGGRSSRIDMNDEGGTIIWTAGIRSLPGFEGVVALSLDSSHELKHIMGQILELYAGTIASILTAKGSKVSTDIAALALNALSAFSETGVNAILITSSAEPARGLIAAVGRKQVKSATLSSGHLSILKEKKKSATAEDIQFLKGAFPLDLEISDIFWDSYKIDGNDIIVAFGGKIYDPEYLASKFREIIADLSTPLSYGDILESLKNLKRDHKAIVKGEKLASVMETAVAVNHEVNNPLTAILGNTQLILLNKQNLPEDVVSKLEIIEKSALRIRQVTQKLLSVVEPHTTSYTEGMQMLDIEGSSSPPSSPAPDKK